MTTPLTIMGADCVLWCAADLTLTIAGTPLLTGTSPAATWSGTLARTDVPFFAIDLGGARGTATFKWSLDGGATFQATGVLTAATVALGSTGITVAFPTGTYVLNDTYTARVSAWTDQAASPNDFVQATAANQPTLANAVKNGVRGIFFKSTYGLRSAITRPALNTASTYFWYVLRQENWTLGFWILAGDSFADPWFIRQASVTPKIGVRDAAAIAAPLNAFARGEAGLKAAASDIFNKEYSATSTVNSGTNHTLAMTGLNLGRPATSGSVQMTVCEVAVFDIFPTRSQLDQLDAYAAAKYGADVIGTVNTSTVSATQAQVAALTKQLGIVRNAAQAQVVAFVRGLGIVRSAAQAQVTSFVRGLGIVRSVAQAQVAASGRTLARFRTFTSTQAQVAALGRTLALFRAFTSTQAQVAALTKQLGIVRNATQAQVAALTKQLGIVRSAAQTQVFTVGVARTLVRAISVAQSQVAAISKAQALARVFVALQAQTATFAQMFRVLGRLGRRIFAGVRSRSVYASIRKRKIP